MATKGTGRKYPRNNISIDGDIAYILFEDESNGGVIMGLVDSKDVELIIPYRWRISNGYVRGVVGDRKSHIYLHRFLGKPPEGFEIDHINRNRLDNRRSNLRSATSSQNKMNRLMRGVSKLKNGKWKAYICANGVHKNIGTFLNEEDAKEARLAAVKKFFGEYAPV